jgi:CheY-like chemotaxis protein
VLPERILIIEDDRTAELLFRIPLERAGFIVDFVDEGYAAIEKLRAYQYAAIVLDLIMHQGLNGFGVLNFLETEQPAMLERVFLVTGMSEQTVMNTAPKLVSRMYRKPFDQRRLIAAITAVARPPVGAGPIKEKCLLVIDDDRLSAELIAVFGRRLGMTVHFAENGREAIEKIATTGDYDTLVLDLLMPGIDGFGVLEYLERLRPDLIPHTIVVSALPERYRERVTRYGVCGFVSKPVDHTQLVSMISRCALPGVAASDADERLANGS